MRTLNLCTLRLPLLFPQHCANLDERPGNSSNWGLATKRKAEESVHGWLGFKEGEHGQSMRVSDWTRVTTSFEGHASLQLLLILLQSLRSHSDAKAHYDRQGHNAGPGANAHKTHQLASMILAAQIPFDCHHMDMVGPVTNAHCGGCSYVIFFFIPLSARRPRFSHSAVSLAFLRARRPPATALRVARVQR